MNGPARNPLQALAGARTVPGANPAGSCQNLPGSSSPFRFSNGRQVADDRLAGFLGQLATGPRMAIEFRHESWNREEVSEPRRAHGVAYRVMSGAGLPCALRSTAGFVFLRRQGPDPRQLHAGSDTDEDLRWWAAPIKEWHADGREEFAYFNNNGFGPAVGNAETPPVDPRQVGPAARQSHANSGTRSGPGRTPGGQGGREERCGPLPGGI
jgi:hypothetical protein